MSDKLLGIALAMFMIPALIIMPLHLLDALSQQFYNYYTYWNIAAFYVFSAAGVINVWDSFD